MWRTPEQELPEASDRQGSSRQNPRVPGVRRGHRGGGSGNANQGHQRSSSSSTTRPSSRNVQGKAPTPSDCYDIVAEKLTEQARATQIKSDADRVLVSAMLENLRKNVDDIEQDKWLYEEQLLF